MTAGAALLVGALIATGCTASPNTGFTRNLVGQHVDSILRSWGQPDNVESDGKGGSVLSWKADEQFLARHPYTSEHAPYAADGYSSYAWRNLDRFQRDMKEGLPSYAYRFDSYGRPYSIYSPTVNVNKSRVWKVWVDPIGMIYRSESVEVQG